MGTSRNNRLSWAYITQVSILMLCTLGPGIIVAGEDRACPGSKAERKQKMELREISPEQLDALTAQYKQAVLSERDRMKEAALRRMEHDYEQSLATGAPFIYDILVISGGGAKGAFGAGFLEGWGTIEQGPYVRPEFDMITGVSTGALIAPFAFIGTDEAYSDVVEFYSNPKQGWVKKRGALHFLPGKVSVVNNCSLQETIRQGMGPDIVKDVAAGAAEDRLLLIGATNLDTGAGRVFDLGHEAQTALSGGSADKMHAIVLASSAIPGVFPPIEIDGMLYADGAGVANLFIAAFPGPDGPLARFAADHPQAELPKVRVWIMVNQRLRPKPAVTQPKWIAVSTRALDTLTSSSQVFVLGLIDYMAKEARADRGVDVELRMVSIPDDAPRNTTGEMFDQDFMRKLLDFGREWGADPTRWETTIPSPFSVQGDWLHSD